MSPTVSLDRFPVLLLDMTPERSAKLKTHLERYESQESWRLANGHNGGRGNWS